MAGLCAPLSTLRRGPRGHLRMTRGRCGSLLLHRDGLAPSTPCRSPGALRFTPMNGHPLAAFKHHYATKVGHRYRRMITARSVHPASPNFLITLASLKSPVAGSPVRLNATAPA